EGAQAPSTGNPGTGNPDSGIPSESDSGAPNDAGASLPPDLGGAGCPTLRSGGAASKWIYVGADGKLAYATMPKGDRILDFSYAGYQGGGVAIPHVPASGAALKPSGGDDTAAIQAAIDAVSKLPPDANGHRGAVELASGTFTLAGTLTINA